MRDTFVIMVGNLYVRSLTRDRVSDVYIVTTADPARALRFASARAGRDYWEANRPAAPPLVALLVACHPARAAAAG